MGNNPEVYHVHSCGNVIMLSTELSVFGQGFGGPFRSTADRIGGKQSFEEVSTHFLDSCGHATVDRGISGPRHTIGNRRSFSSPGITLGFRAESGSDDPGNPL